MTATTEPAPELLSDDEVLAFINHGYHIVEPCLPAEFHAEVCRQLDGIEGNPGNAILEAVPSLADVYAQPAVRGALISLLGEDCRMHHHRHLHTNLPGSRSQNWHQDGTNKRHEQVWRVLAMYYPHDVTADMGPTMAMPGTHFRNAPTDRLQTYANLKGQVALTVEAGTVAITHYDLWHAASRNCSDQPRQMLKFLFDRQSEPAAPSWAHDPETAKDAFRRRCPEMVGAQGYCSDYYIEWELRAKCWLWMQGTGETRIAPTFEDLLG